jgi:hypothetical protein
LKWSQLGTTYWPKIRPPLSLVIRFHMTGTANNKGTQQAKVDCFAVDTVDLALGVNYQVPDWIS